MKPKYLVILFVFNIVGCGGGALLYEGEYEITNRGIIVDKRTENNSFSEEDILRIISVAAIEAVESDSNTHLSIAQYFLADNLGKSKEYAYIARLLDNSFIRIYSEKDTFRKGDCIELIEYDEDSKLVVDAGNCDEYKKAYSQAINSTR